VFSINVEKIKSTADSGMLLLKFLLTKALNTLNGTLGKVPGSGDA
jgi:hypothetical protein